MALHSKINPIEFDKEAIDDYFFHCKNLHNTPSESFFKHTIFGLRAAYKVVGKTEIREKLPQLKRQNDLPVVLNREEVKQLINAPKYLKNRLVLYLV